MKPSSRPPPIRAYWFHASPYPLDDPLAPLPIPASVPVVKQTYRPFSYVDSTALEAAYQTLPVQRHIRPTSSVSSLRNRPQAPREVAAEGRPGLGRTTTNTSAVSVAVELHDGAGANEPVSQVPIAPPPLNGSRPSSLSGKNNGTAVNPLIRPQPFARLQTRRSPSPSGSHMSSPKTPPPPSPPIEMEQVEVPVGIQRLHKVLLPSFVMTPLYWSPLHHIASVVRGTWFYKDTLLPVKAEVANRLEAGWEEVRAWTEEWEMELASAVEVGWEGEKKVRWQLWDKQSLSTQSSRPGTATEEGAGMPGLGDVPPVPMGGTDTVPNECDWVLFANGTDAYICRDSILSFGNKRPLANIRRGKTVGTHVIRGFQASEWGRLHPSKRKRKLNDPAATRRSSSSSLAKPEPQEGEKGGDTGATPGCPVPGSVSPGETRLGPGEEERTEVTELFLVIHGIGQKLSERVESFHFTHAINSFRRHINVELQDPAVKPHLRNDGSIGMMVLPINWRHNLTFEDEAAGGPINRSSDFSLTDITPPTIPAVRNLIGDVMLDIPYYLSHHKQTMINAVVKEANRVYRLWCSNNPHFEKEGRVHIIAHSLGAVIAMDILSKQPTRLDTKLEEKKEDMFEFDTKNVFFVGSPAGFFLLLNKSGLLPRKGRNKPGAGGEDLGDGVAGEAGTYGCLAVDNIYNVLHYSDPIAYRLNPTVDIEYDASLKTAYVPSSTPSLFSTIFRPFSSASTHSAAAIPQIPTMPRLPSTIELQTHDFSREELAEKRMYLLNDNGQIDWYLPSGAGAMENQYLNILGAHSSYWESRDFVRFCVCEVGRTPGRNAGNGLAVRKKARSGFG